MKAALLVVDVQQSFSPPKWLMDQINVLLPNLMSVATVERHDESVVLFQKQLGWKPRTSDDCLVDVNYVFIKHGYLLPPQLVSYLRTQRLSASLFAAFRLRHACLRQALRYLMLDRDRLSWRTRWFGRQWTLVGRWAFVSGDIILRVSQRPINKCSRSGLDADVPSLPRSCQSGMSAGRSLSRGKQKSHEQAISVAFDPQRTFGRRLVCWHGALCLAKQKEHQRRQWPY